MLYVVRRSERGREPGGESQPDPSCRLRTTLYDLIVIAQSLFPEYDDAEIVTLIEAALLAGRGVFLHPQSPS
jgi:hypothetical protein